MEFPQNSLSLTKLQNYSGCGNWITITNCHLACSFGKLLAWKMIRFDLMKVLWFDLFVQLSYSAIEFNKIWQINESLLVWLISLYIAVVFCNLIYQLLNHSLWTFFLILFYMKCYVYYKKRSDFWPLRHCAEPVRHVWRNDGRNGGRFGTLFRNGKFAEKTGTRRPMSP